ncbi:MAG: hypothetical protein NTV06_07765 [candidate division Zixibacteria bacterium]|nr:hypothetical protein [candidate division Zixibacteria bacterium]
MMRRDQIVRFGSRPASFRYSSFFPIAKMKAVRDSRAIRVIETGDNPTNIRRVGHSYTGGCSDASCMYAI